jgi:hypothetical protein
MDFQPKIAFNGNPKIANYSDIQAFTRAISRRGQDGSWWRENVDLSSYYSYRSILECIHHYDVDAGKNYFFYLRPDTGKWVALPWDIDLSWGDHMFGGGREPFVRAGLLARAPFKQEYQERLAEIRDLLFNPEQIGLLIDEHSAMISDPAGGPSLVDADRAKWDYNPVLASRHVFAGKAGQGKFYFEDPRNTFETMVNYMKNYAAKRAKWIDQRLLSDYHPPAAPEISAMEEARRSGAPLVFGITSPAEDSTACDWRLAEEPRIQGRPAVEVRDRRDLASSRRTVEKGLNPRGATRAWAHLPRSCALAGGWAMEPLVQTC